MHAAWNSMPRNLAVLDSICVQNFRNWHLGICERVRPVAHRLWGHLHSHCQRRNHWNWCDVAQALDQSTKMWLARPWPLRQAARTNRNVHASEIALQLTAWLMNIKCCTRSFRVSVCDTQSERAVNVTIANPESTRTFCVRLRTFDYIDSLETKETVLENRS